MDRPGRVSLQKLVLDVRGKTLSIFSGLVLDEGYEVWKGGGRDGLEVGCFVRAGGELVEVGLGLVLLIGCVEATSMASKRKDR